ncbi:uncharacterized protein [Magallana gigas]|uniref:uncharacterized protein isoform X1 n=1 Tax=Magallana gigas TaxID=29159 RepID=UPI003342AD88
MLQREIDVFLWLCFVTAALAQNQGCIAGNTTLKFKHETLKCKMVIGYMWSVYKGMDLFIRYAMFEPNVSADLIIYNDDIFHHQDRIFHSPDEPATLYLTNLRKSDEVEYVLLPITCDTCVGGSCYRYERLTIKDICFDKAKEMGPCTLSTCYTGENGTIETPDNQTETVNGSELVTVCNESASGTYSCCNAEGKCLQQFFEAKAFAEDQVSECISGNVTMEFKPDILKDEEVKSYTWIWDQGHESFHMFAKFEQNKSTNLITYFEDFHRLTGRIFHSPKVPTTINITNLRESDEAKYYLEIRYANFENYTGYNIYLKVKGVCFDDPVEIKGCNVATCYTGENGILKIPSNLTEEVNGSKLVKVCDESASRKYSCCNAAGICQEQVLKVIEDTTPLDDEPGSTVIITTLIIVLVIAVAVGGTAGVLLFLKRRRGTFEIKQ